MRRPVLKAHASLFALILRASDPVIAALVGLLAYVSYVRDSPAVQLYVLFMVVAAVLIVAMFPAFRLYEPQRGASIAEELGQLVLAWAATAALASVAVFFTKSGSSFSRVWLISWVAGSFAAGALLRIVVRVVLRSLRRRGYNLRHVAVVGAGALGQQIVQRLQAAAWTGLNVVAFYDDDAAKIGRKYGGVPVLGTTDQLPMDLSRIAVDQVWIALPLRAEARIAGISIALRDSPVELRFVPDIYGFHLLNHSLTEVAGLPVISLTETPMTEVNQVLKRCEDLFLGTLALIVSAPAMLLIALGVKLSSPGPVFYGQDRMTRNAAHFRMYKFRTMPHGLERDGPMWSGDGAARATRFGAFLRRFSLDELPQLLNVLRGEMTLVGPRPERPEFVAQFRRQIPGYMQKHLVKAGITGWAQVNDLRGDSDIPARLQYDLYYIDHWSVWFDLRILSLTLWHILTSRKAR
ncbi:MAG: undecaprenyl-phosphate glucose phosphotransferase [Casimicrobiaceae bacterium]